MKSTAIACAIAAATLGFGSVSYAQDGRGGDDRRDYDQGSYQRRDGRPEARQDRREARRDIQEARRDLRDARNDRHYDRGYQARQSQFHRGGYMPTEYRGQRYYVNDWRSRHLSAPPRGHQWMQVGSDYVLIAIATGVIANLVLSQ